MPEPLTLDALKRELSASEERVTKTLRGELTRAVTASEERVIKNLTKKIDDATIPHFTALSHDLDEITQRLTAIEKLLWQGQRLEEIELRLIRLAELTGNASLAVPFSKPIGA